MLNYQTKPYHLQPSCGRFRSQRSFLFSYISPTVLQAARSRSAWGQISALQLHQRGTSPPDDASKAKQHQAYTIRNSRNNASVFAGSHGALNLGPTLCQTLPSWQPHMLPHASLGNTGILRTREWILCTRSSGCLIEWAIWHCILISKFKIFQGV